jgi:1,4-dihydroxy-2-naphthoate octaprenyltransferase
MFKVVLQMELFGVLWAILGALAYIAHCIRTGWPPLILCFLSFCVATFYLIGSYLKARKDA